MFQRNKTTAFVLIVFVFGVMSSTIAQNTQIENQKPPKFQLRGYVKDLRLLNQTRNFGAVQDNFIHNRLNFKYFASKSVTVNIEMRNRLFYGETVKLDANYWKRIHQDIGLLNTSVIWVKEPGMFFHSVIDRANLNYRTDKWDINIGRQRINWGINTIWNPNDLFNTYNFVDFDYEERPGSDAIRVQRNLNGMSTIELAIKPDTGINNQVIAGRYTFNRFNYDFQILGGLYYNDINLGIGWAGNLKTAGFKGEASYFHPHQKLDSNGVLVLSSGIDYSFRNGLYLSGGFLFNSGGITNINQLNNPSLFTGNLTAKNLMPNKYSLLVQTSKAFSPILSGSIAGIYAQGINVTFLMPSVTISISNNWEFMILGQLYGGPQQSQYNLLGSTLFLRTKFSF